MLPTDELYAVFATPDPRAAVDAARLATLVRQRAKVHPKAPALGLATALVGPQVDTATVREVEVDLAALPAPARLAADALAVALGESPADAAALRLALATRRDALSVVLGAPVPFSVAIDATVLQAARESARHGGDLGKKGPAAEELVRRVARAVGAGIGAESPETSRAALAALDPEALARAARRQEITVTLEKTLAKGTPSGRAP